MNNDISAIKLKATIYCVAQKKYYKICKFGIDKTGALAVGTGLSIINPEMVKNEDYDGIAELARRHVEAIKAFKNR